MAGKGKGKHGGTAKQAQRVRVLDGKKVTPVLWAGESRYIAGQVNGTTILDSKDKPIPYKQIGKLVCSHEI